jgi:hypothetical protein
MPATDDLTIMTILPVVLVYHARAREWASRPGSSSASSDRQGRKEGGQAMALTLLLPGRAYLDVGGERHFLHVAGGVVQVDGALLRRSVPIETLMDLVLEPGAAADEFLEPVTGDGRPGSDHGAPATLPAGHEPRPTAACPRCGEVSSGAFSAQVCHACGHGWRSAPPDDVEDRPGGEGNDR